MLKEPLVSIVTPSLNQGKYIRDTIESVLAQDYSRVEYLIIDGGSDDRTIDIIQEYGDRLFWLTEPDNGQADAINKGFSLAKGDFLAWLNSDDIYEPDAISNAVRVLSSRKEISMIYGHGLLIDENGKNIGEFISKPINPRAAIYHGDISVFQPSVFIRRKVFETIGHFDINLELTFDIDYWIRIALGGQRSLCLEKAYASLRCHPLTKTYQNLGLHRYHHLEMLRKYTVSARLFYYLRHIILVNVKKIIFGDISIMRFFAR